MVRRRALMAMALGGLLPGCGFRPLYAARDDGKMGPAQAGLAETNIALIPERIGQELRNALLARFQGSGTGSVPRYDLAVAFGIGVDVVGIQPDSSATRVRLIGNANWTLRAQDVQRSTLAAGTARAVEGYNPIENQAFTADLESEAVQARIAEAVADQITLQLAAYFTRHAS